MAKELAKPQKTIRDFLHGEEFKSQIALALPRHISPDRFVRISLTALTRTPNLANCDQSSFFMQLMTLSQLGLEPDGRLAHLIPFKNNKKGITECQLIVDYKGLAALAMRSGQISKIHADKVCEKDVFEFDTGEVKKHGINFREDRGAAYAYYALVVFKDGTQKADCMTKSEVDAIRKRSRAASDGPWVTDYDEMAKKTVFRRLTKWLELSPEYRDALEADFDRPALEITAEKIPQFDIPTSKQEVHPHVPLKPADFAIETLRGKLKERGVSEKVFCQGLTILGYEIGDIDSLDELRDNQGLLTQLADQPMNEILDEMEDRSQPQQNDEQ